MSDQALLPDDPYDRALRDHVHPSDWVAPEPAERYKLVVIGGGPAGLVAAFGAAGLGARVALVERGLLGGDCLVTGCVPSKALLRVGHAAHAARDAGRFGVSTGEVSVDFPEAMRRMRALRADMAPHDSAKRLTAAGVDVFFGAAAFSGADSVAVTQSDGRALTLRFARCLIATGARAVVPPIPGVEEVGARTHETLFTLTERPARLTVIGAGVIGCELAQAFARMGSAVTLIDLAERVLSREDPEAAALVQAQLEADGVRLRLGAGVARFELDGATRVTVLEGGEHREVRVEADEILLAVGRRPNLELGLERGGVAFTTEGVGVDAHLQTSNPRVYAAGDVIGQAAFTHAADHHARLALRNALFFGRAKVGDLVIPRVTYTHPELAAVGCSEAEAEAAGLRVYTARVGEIDRGRTDGEAAGFCRVYADHKGRIHGATVVGEQAGELLAPLTLAMTHGLTLGQLAGTVHPYPTRSELVFKVAAAYNKTRFTPLAQRLSAWLMSVRR